MDKTICALLAFILLPAFSASSQTTAKIGAAQTVSAKPSAPAKASPAYAEVLLRKTERSAELEELRLDYTEEFPKVKELTFELSLLQAETDKMLAVNQSDAGKLTLALGKLIVRKIELQIDLWNLRIQYKDEQADVRRARRRVEVYEKAIREILP